MLKFVTPDMFREYAEKGEIPAEIGVRKQFIAEVKSEDDAARKLSFTISTESIDRDGDKIALDGWRLENYKKNPVVLWAHDYRRPPVGKSTEIWTENGKLKSVTEFVPSDNPATGKFAEGIYQLYKQGFMSATSVGFRPIKWAWTEDTDRKFGIDFEETELLEYSVVPVPANAEALIEARGAGIDLAPLKQWAGSVLQAEGIKTIREFEDFLRDAGGFSGNRAKMLASHGWFDEQREAAQTCKNIAARCQRILAV